MIKYLHFKKKKRIDPIHVVALCGCCNCKLYRRGVALHLNGLEKVPKTLTKYYRITDPANAL